MSDNLSKEKGDFHKFHRPQAGSRTVEGNTSGARAMRLEQQRLKDQEVYEAQKRQTIRDNANASLNIHSKFQSARIGTTEEQAFKAKTVGLVTAQEFVKATHEKEGNGSAELTPEQQQALKQKQDRQAKKELKKRKRKRKQQKQRQALLSFGNDENDENENENEQDENETTETETTTIKKKQSKKDPTIDTSFLPDKERETAMIQKRLRLEQEWKQQQLQLQDEKLEITYSYWDGSGHRRNCKIKKGDTVGDFLEVARADLARDFRELKNSVVSVASDALLYVKEDLILPHDISFYDLIATKARGKSGPLFRFDVKDDIRVGAIDVRVEKDESHPGKVVERSWYEKHKHIFPASRWEVFDPLKNYGGYTIAGKIVVTNENKRNKNIFATK